MSETGSRESANTKLPSGEKVVSDPPVFEYKRVGRYDIIYPIAVGGMATVHVGRLSGMAGFERLVAVKIIHTHLAQEQAFVEMFLDEARHAAGIHHQNVGEIYEVGEDAGLYYMVGELVLGQDLNRLLARAGERQQLIDPTLCAYIIARVCRGLHEAHDLISPEGEPINLVHRDISPRNILISYKGDVKVIDFGVAWARGRLAHTEAGSVKGKVGFIPPEHIRGEPLDRRSDIFALGVVLYLLATRVHPFPGMSDAERLTKILTGRMKPPRSVEPNVDPRLEEVIMKAMAPKREERYQTAAEMAKDLDVYVRGDGSMDHGELLSKMMMDFFGTEIKTHHEKIRKYRRLHNEATDSYTPTGNASGVMPKDTLPAEEQSPGEQKRDTDSAKPQVYVSKARSVPPLFGRFTRSQLTKWTAALGAVLLVLAISIGLMRSGDELSGEGKSQLAEVSFGLDQNRGEGIAGSSTSPDGKIINILLRISEPKPTISLDGAIQEEGLRKLTIPADQKEHSLMVEKKGFFTYYETIKADKDKIIVINLKRLPSSSSSTLEENASLEMEGEGDNLGTDAVKPKKRKRTRSQRKEPKNTSIFRRKRNTGSKTNKGSKKSSSGSPTLERSPYR